MESQGSRPHKFITRQLPEDINMGILVLIAIITWIYALCKEGFERELPADYHRNWRLEQEDANKMLIGQMSKKEFIRNMNNGKYR